MVRAAVDGRDTLALMPTGSGKSLTYQLAAMLRPTPTLVLSPLIALMKDQVDKLPAEVAAQATLINSSLDPDEAAARLRAAAAGRYRLLYVAPERLRQRHFLDAIAGIDVGLVVIDEVHCVSMWGHDFRPDYLFIRRALDALGRPAILGMTATATPATEREIAAALGRSRRSCARVSSGRTCATTSRSSTARRIASARSSAGSTTSRRLGDRLRPFAPKLRDPGTHTSRPRSRRRPLPRRARSSRSARPPRRPSSRAGSRPSSRPLPSGWGSTSPTSGSSRSTTTPSRSRATCRWSAAPDATGDRRTRSCSRADPTRPAAPVRALRHPDGRRPPHRLRTAARPARGASGGAW